MNGEKILRARWKDVKAFASADDALRFHAGDKSVVPLWEHEDKHNAVTDLGIEYVLDAAFVSGSQSDPWYAGLIDNAGFDALALGDTSGSHVGWDEYSDYSQATRPELTFAAADNRQISATVLFTMTESVTLQGLAVWNANTKGGSSGLLFGTLEFDAPAALSTGNVLTANYGIYG